MPPPTAPTVFSETEDALVQAAAWFQSFFFASTPRDRRTDQKIDALRSKLLLAEEHLTILLDPESLVPLSSRLSAARTALAGLVPSEITEVYALLNTAQRVSNRQPTPAPFMTNTWFLDEMRGLQQRYDDFVWNDSSKALSVTLRDDVVLIDPTTDRSYNLGRFRITLDCVAFKNTFTTPRNRFSDVFQITALDPSRSHDGTATGQHHPHVNAGQVCPGDGITGIETRLPMALKSGRVLDAFNLLMSLLKTYNPGSPYRHLIEWNTVACHNCEVALPLTARHTCVHCNNTVCGSCSHLCGTCNRRFCDECAILEGTEKQCPCRHQTLCSECHTPSSNINRTSGLCPTCQYTLLQRQGLTGVRQGTRTRTIPVPTTAQAPTTNPTRETPSPRQPVRPDRNRPTQSFDLLAGLDEAPRVEAELVDVLPNPDIYAWARIPLSQQLTDVFSTELGEVIDTGPLPSAETLTLEPVTAVEETITIPVGRTVSLVAPVNTTSRRIRSATGEYILNPDFRATI